jgi:hypothetical protein
VYGRQVPEPDLSAARFAALVAPAVTRTFVAGILAGGTDGRDLVESYGGEAVGYLIDLRNPLAAGRRLTTADLAAVHRYRAPEEVDETVGRSVAHGLLDRSADGSITAADRGLAFLRDLFALHGRALTRRWGTGGNQTGAMPHPDRVDRLTEVLGRVLAEAAATGGAAWATQAPPYEPARTPPGVLLLNRLSTLRYHRADAYAAAWQAAGLTAAEIAAMPWGRWSPQRRAVEDDTDARAAAPYAVLTPEQRLRLLADLSALP